MTSALTAYMTTAAASLGTANQLSNQLNSGVVTTKATTVGTSAGANCFGEVYAQGNAGAWPALGAIGNPSGNGFLYDVTTLEGQQILAGTWTPTLRLALSVGTSITADVYCRAYKRSSGGVYTLIGTNLFSGKSITTAGNNVNFAGSSFSAVSFASGDKLYVDIWLNITANSSGSGSATVKMNEANATNTGIATAQMITPGYQSNQALIRAHHRSIGRIQ